MQANRSRDTQPELAIRRQLHSMGYRYRVGIRPLPSLRRTADLVFSKEKLAVFVDGCFWHLCAVHGGIPKSNVEFWVAKLNRNVERDRETDALLSAAGWWVMRIWEHDDPKQAAETVARQVLKRRLDRIPLR
jgi:DNA mismatch endonuclease (patch repair protein)